MASGLAVCLLAFVFFLTKADLISSQNSNQEPAKDTPKSEEDEKQRVLQTLDSLLSLAEKIQVPEIRVKVYTDAARLMLKEDRSRAQVYLRQAYTVISQLQPGLRDKLSLKAAAAEKQLEELKKRLLSQIVGMASDLDPELAKEIIRAAGQNNKRDGQLGASSGHDTQVEMANTVLRSDTKRAVELVEESLRHQVTDDSIGFLLTLRTGDPQAADKLFETTLARLAVNPQARIMDLMTLGMYFTPLPGRSVNVDLMQRYVNTVAAGVTGLAAVSSQLPPTVQQKLVAVHRMAAGLAQTYSRFAPEMAMTLHNALLPLGAQLGIGQTGSQVTLPSSEDSTTGPRSDSTLVKQVDQAIAKNEFQLARQLVERIDNPTVRESKKLDLNVKAAKAALEAGDFQEAHKNALAVTAKFERADLLIEIAKRLVEKKETDQAKAYLTEAATIIQKEDASPEKARVEMEVARTLIGVDVPSAFQSASAFVTTLNRLWTSSAGDQQAYEMLAGTFDDASVLFASFGQTDFDQTMAIVAQLDKADLQVPLGVAACRGALTRLATARQKGGDREGPSKGTSK